MVRVALVALLLLGAPLIGCATAEETASQDDAKCASYGASSGSPGYASCRVTLDQGRRQARLQALQSLGDSLRDTPPPPASGLQSTAAGGSCFKAGEQVGGLNKICTYNCVGSARAITIGAAQLCPLMLN